MDKTKEIANIGRSLPILGTVIILIAGLGAYTWWSYEGTPAKGAESATDTSPQHAQTGAPVDTLSSRSGGSSDVPIAARTAEIATQTDEDLVETRQTVKRQWQVPNLWGPPQYRVHWTASNLKAPRGDETRVIVQQGEDSTKEPVDISLPSSPLESPKGSDDVYPDDSFSPKSPKLTYGDFFFRDPYDPSRYGGRAIEQRHCNAKEEKGGGIRNYELERIQENHELDKANKLAALNKEKGANGRGEGETSGDKSISGGGGGGGGGGDE